MLELSINLTDCYGRFVEWLGYHVLYKITAFRYLILPILKFLAPIAESEYAALQKLRIRNFWFAGRTDDISPPSPLLFSHQTRRNGTSLT